MRLLDEPGTCSTTRATETRDTFGRRRLPIADMESFLSFSSFLISSGDMGILDSSRCNGACNGVNPAEWEGSPIFGRVKPFLGEVAISIETVPAFSSSMTLRIREALKHHELRTGEDLSWAELGRRVWALLQAEGDSAKWVSRVKLGPQQPSVAEGGAIAYLLNVSPLWLFWEIGDMGDFPITVGVARDVSALEAHIETPIKSNRIPVLRDGAVKNPRKRTGGSK